MPSTRYVYTSRRGLVNVYVEWCPRGKLPCASRCVARKTVTRNRHLLSTCERLVLRARRDAGCGEAERIEEGVELDSEPGGAHPEGGPKQLERKKRLANGRVLEASTVHCHQGVACGLGDFRQHCVLRRERGLHRTQVARLKQRGERSGAHDEARVSTSYDLPPITTAKLPFPTVTMSWCSSCVERQCMGTLSSRPVRLPAGPPEAWYTKVPNASWLSA